jgi:sugar lactone lactonase YvrE
MNDLAAGEIEVLADDACYTESPRWRDGALWFSDIGAGQVRRIASGGAKEVAVSTIRTPSGLGWTRSGELLVASIDDAAIYRVGGDGAPSVLCGHERHGVHGTNDMATAGPRSYVTCSGRVFERGDGWGLLSQPVGKILLLDHDSGEARVVADGMRMPNGVAITPDGETLIVAEVFAQRILAFDIAADGQLSGQRVWAEVGHLLDGLCLDAEGCVWIGGTGSGGFKRIAPGGGVLETVAVPGWSCIAPMLGGPDGRDLFMAASQMDDPDAIFDGRAKGRILRARVSVPAAAEARW